MVQSRRRCLSLLLAPILALTFLFGTPAISLAQSEPQTPAEPQIGAAAAIVVEYPSGRILYEKAAHDQLPPASLTKIMTAILALEYGNLDDVITVSPDDLVGESTMGLVAGEQQTLHNLLYGLLLPSGNDAAMAIARYLGDRLSSGEAPDKDPVARFADMMNMRVAQLGLTDTHFITPHGLDAPGHYSSAYDLASLAWYALHLPTFNEIVKTVSYDAPGHSLLNTNEMLTRYPGADGIKTGWTDGCGLCLVTSATRDGHRLISVVLNAPDWYSDSGTILDYGFAQLAAKPDDPAAETLSVAKRDSVAWLLANPGASLPIGQVQNPPSAPNAALAQGGGSASQPAQAAPQQPQQQTHQEAQRLVAQQSQTQQVLPGHELEPAVTPEADASSADRPLEAAASGAGQGGPESAPTLTRSANQSGPDFGLLLTLAALLASACLVVVARFFGAGPSSILARAQLFPLFAGRRRTAGHAGEYHLSAPDPSNSGNEVRPSHFTLPQTQAQAPRPRREPNLLAELENEAGTHVERAIVHAAEGRQGSAMSEFLLALKPGADLDVAELAERYRLSAGAFLALSRAQVAAGKPEQARRTLLHGVLVMPADRLLRLALYQLPTQS